MRLRIIDYRPHTGGGKRYFDQLACALHAVGHDLKLEFVSHGEALAQIRALASERGIRAGFVDLAYGRILQDVGITWYAVPARALEGCDVAWFPWVHHHRLPPNAGPHVVGSFHDALMFTEPRLTSKYPSLAVRERETTRQWLASSATIVCSSRFTIDVLAREFQCTADRFSMVALSGRHVLPAATRAAGEERWPWLGSPFLLCPANTSLHKNHEVLLEGYAGSALPWPLVLTGPGADLTNTLPPVRKALRRVAVAAGLRPPHRSEVLRRQIDKLALSRGQAVKPLGYLSDADYETVLGRAACVVITTLGEGGGSFPVEEALLHGIPAICSDIPVLREQMVRLGASVMWFNPREPRELAARLQELKAGLPAMRSAAKEQARNIPEREWADVARDYVNVFRAAAAVPVAVA